MSKLVEKMKLFLSSKDDTYVQLKKELKDLKYEFKTKIHYKMMSDHVLSSFDKRFKSIVEGKRYLPVQYQIKLQMRIDDFRKTFEKFGFGDGIEMVSFSDQRKAACSENDSKKTSSTITHHGRWEKSSSEHHRGCESGLEDRFNKLNTKSESHLPMPMDIVETEQGNAVKSCQNLHGLVAGSKVVYEDESRKQRHQSRRSNIPEVHSFSSQSQMKQTSSTMIRSEPEYQKMKAEETNWRRLSSGGYQNEEDLSHPTSKDSNEMIDNHQRAEYASERITRSLTHATQTRNMTAEEWNRRRLSNEKYQSEVSSHPTSKNSNELIDNRHRAESAAERITSNISHTNQIRDTTEGRVIQEKHQTEYKMGDSNMIITRSRGKITATILPNRESVQDTRRRTNSQCDQLDEKKTYNTERIDQYVSKGDVQGTCKQHQTFIERYKSSTEETEYVNKQKSDKVEDTKDYKSPSREKYSEQLKQEKSSYYQQSKDTIVEPQIRRTTEEHLPSTMTKSPQARTSLHYQERQDSSVSNRLNERQKNSFDQKYAVDKHAYRDHPSPHAERSFNLHQPQLEHQRRRIEDNDVQKMKTTSEVNSKYHSHFDDCKRSHYHQQHYGGTRQPTADQRGNNQRTTAHNYKKNYYQDHSLPPVERGVVSYPHYQHSKRAEFVPSTYPSNEQSHHKAPTRRKSEEILLQQVEVAKEVVEEEPLEILDVHQYFTNDYDLTTLNESVDVMTQVETVEKWAKTFEDRVSNFAAEKYSLEYFVLDEKLMRLIEHLDKLKCKDNEAATSRKIGVIQYIKRLHSVLDSNARDE